MAAKKTAKPQAPAQEAAPAPAWIPSAEEAKGAAFVPTDGAIARGATPTKVDACAPFLLVHHPERWTVMAGTVIPLFCRMPLVPGLNGADQIRTHDGRTKVLAGAAKNAWEEKGCQVIAPSNIPAHHARGGVMSYLWQPEGRKDATLLIYTRCYPGSADVDVDVPRYLEFCQHLIDNETIAPVPVHVLRKMTDKQRDRVDKLADKVASMPSLKPQVDAARAELSTLEAVLAERIAEQVESPAIPSDGDAFALDIG